jgi:ribonuclease BN (tRNA processing enzyme)
MNVTMLGTGGPLSFNRFCMGMLVSAPGCQPLLLDTCGGMELARALHAAGFKIPDITNVVVTHRHLDHAGGMQALILAGQPVTVHGLGDTIDGIETVKSGCFPEWGTHNPKLAHQRDPLYQEIASGEVKEIGGFRVEFFAVEHRVPTVAVRITHDQKTLTYSADSLPCKALVDAARNADLFVCDALLAERANANNVAQAGRLMHPTAHQAGTMAREAGVKRLACVHTAGRANVDIVLQEAVEASGLPTVHPIDGETLVV